MGRKKKNQYRIVSNGLTINLSLLEEWSRGKTDTEIIREILICKSFFNVLENFDSGKRKIKLNRVKEHKEVAEC